ncbi:MULTISPECIES: FecR domain-containing protein [unclassified Herbaspirillum]|uniref:FecR family protein n=1 Tax=unclassified Herbaspirillum TaxID=2624150 RepID=UPI00114FE0D6|nr:hypothetical protein [Herbaspirillum sp. SJZ102]
MKPLNYSRWAVMARRLAGWWMALALLAAAGAVQAQAVGKVTHLSGLLTARHADGTRTVLAVKSAILQGDTLITERETYTRVQFLDNAEIVLRPGSEVVVAKYVYDEKKPENDSVAINLVKGGLRAVTGLVGKRNHDAVSFDTPTATIGIRGTTFIAQFCSNNCGAASPVSGAGSLPAPLPLPQAAPIQMPAPAATGAMTAETASAGAAQAAAQTAAKAAAAAIPAAAPGLPPGLYVQVLDGLINVSNRGGAQNFSAGQFGYTPNLTTPPVILPQNPGLKFLPPPSFNSTPPVGQQTGAGKAVDCVVR